MSAYDEGHLIAEVILGRNKYVDKVIVMGDCSSDRAVEVWAELQKQLVAMVLRVKRRTIQDYSCT